jgi:hypothetical protein
VTTWADLTTFTIQFNISNLEIDYLFILLPPTHTHTHVPSVPELDLFSNFFLHNWTPIQNIAEFETSLIIFAFIEIDKTHFHLHPVVK